MPNNIEYLGLGDMVREMHKVYAKDPTVINESDVGLTKENKQNRKQYNTLCDALNEREKVYAQLGKPFVMK